jgi:hypothetical protein
MRLDAAFEILEFLQADGIMITSARERATGKPVQFHVFPPERSKDASEICERVMSLPEEARRKVIRFGKDGSATYFLTEPLPSGVSIARWVVQFGAQTAALPVPPAQPAPPPPAASSGPGEFTQLYLRADMSTGRPEQAAAPPPPPPPAQPEPGSFTQMYSKEQMRSFSQSMPTLEFQPPAASTPPPAPAKEAPGLETFIGMKPEFGATQGGQTPLSPGAAAPTLMQSGTLRFQKQSVVVPAPSFNQPAPASDPFASTNTPYVPSVGSAPPVTPSYQAPVRAPSYSLPSAATPSFGSQAFAVPQGPENVQPQQPPRPVLPPAHPPVRMEARAPSGPIFDWKVGLVTTVALLLVGAIVVVVAG